MTRRFTFQEAERLLPEVRRLTADAHVQVQSIRARMEAGTLAAAEIESEAAPVLRAWTEAIQAMGIEVKGLWLVDFDNGSGYYCWQWPEPSLRYFHTYEDGFGGRVPIQ